MVFDRKCFNVSPEGRSCLALTVKACPEKCSARITDPIKYLDLLQDLLTYNSDNLNTSASLKRRITEHRNKYKLGGEENVKESGSMAGLAEAYWEDTHRGERGGQSEGNANPAGAKQKMKDNRPQECKLTKAEKQEIYETTKKFEEEHGKLDKLGRSLLSRTKVDSYTGEEIVEPKRKPKKK
jgi:hypothetical protein